MNVYTVGHMCYKWQFQIKISHPQDLILFGWIVRNPHLQFYQNCWVPCVGRWQCSISDYKTGVWSLLLSRISLECLALVKFISILECVHNYIHICRNAQLLLSRLMCEIQILRVFKDKASEMVRIRNFFFYFFFYIQEQKGLILRSGFVNSL